MHRDVDGVWASEIGEDEKRRGAQSLWGRDAHNTAADLGRITVETAPFRERRRIIAWIIHSRYHDRGGCTKPNIPCHRRESLCLGECKGFRNGTILGRCHVRAHFDIW